MVIQDNGFDDPSKWAVSGAYSGGAAIQNSRGEMRISTGPYRINESSRGTISQVVNMPSDYFINFHYEMHDATDFPGYRCRVLVDGATVWERYIPRNGYASGNPTIDLSLYTGIHTLSFQMDMTYAFYAYWSATSYFYIDNIVDSCPDLKANMTIL